MRAASRGTGTGDVARSQQGLVDYLRQEGCLRSAAVETAFRAVARHRFVPGVPVQEVYRDQAIPIARPDGARMSAASQPAIVAAMLEQLDLCPGQGVLEIGAGSGFNACLMAHLVGPSGEVVSLDIDDYFAATAASHVSTAGYGDRVRVLCADGGFGYAAAAPYHRIILTVGASDIAPAWWEQLKPGGRLVLPLSLSLLPAPQVSVAFVRGADCLESVSVQACGFMPLRGAFAAPGGASPLPLGPGLSLTVADPGRVDAERLAASLSGTARDLATGIQVTGLEVIGGLSLWLALRQPGFCNLLGEGDAGGHAGIAWPISWPVPHGRHAYTAGLCRTDTLCLLTRPPGEGAPPDSDPGPAPFALFLRALGPDLALGKRLLHAIRAWDRVGRPHAGDLQLRAYPRAVEVTPGPAERLVCKPNARLVLRWASASRR